MRIASRPRESLSKESFESVTFKGLCVSLPAALILCDVDFEAEKF